MAGVTVRRMWFLALTSVLLQAGARLIETGGEISF